MNKCVMFNSIAIIYSNDLNSKNDYIIIMSYLYLLATLLIVPLVEFINNYLSEKQRKDVSTLENPFSIENPEYVKDIEERIEKIITPEYDWNFYKWVPLYFKYKYKVSPSYFEFKSYDILYEEETFIFEKELLKTMAPCKRILDFGCGSCKMWRNNLDFLETHDVHCIDLDRNRLAYPKYLLNDQNITITNDDFFTLDLNYDCILFSEVIMQVPHFENVIKHIVKHNPNMTILVNHTAFSQIVAGCFGSIRNNVIQYVPLLNICKGKLLTYRDTVEQFMENGCSLVEQKNIRENKIIYVFKPVLTENT